MHLLYCSYGNRTEDHLQISFSIISFLQQADKISSINIFTDGAAFYKHLSHRVNVIDTPIEKFRAWRGQYDFSWRIKLKAMEHAASLYKGSPIMYLDGDTFLASDISPLVQSLESGKAHMHLDEGSLAKGTTKTWKKLWADVQGKSYGGIAIDSSYHMWNAGVAALPNTKNGEDIALTLKICDELCAHISRKTMAEQYALSVALKKTYSLSSASEYIVHYWSTKPEWNTFISKWFAESYLKQKSIDEMIGEFSSLPLQQIPVSMKRRSTEGRLKNLVEKAFAPSDIQYLKK